MMKDTILTTVIAAHIVMLPPCYLGTLIMARCPMIFLPRPVVFGRLKTALATYALHLFLAPLLSEETRQNNVAQSGRTGIIHYDVIV